MPTRWPMLGGHSLDPAARQAHARARAGSGRAVYDWRASATATPTGLGSRDSTHAARARMADRALHDRHRRARTGRPAHRRGPLPVGAHARDGRRDPRGHHFTVVVPRSQRRDASRSVPRVRWCVEPAAVAGTRWEQMRLPRAPSGASVRRPLCRRVHGAAAGAPARSWWSIHDVSLLRASGMVRVARGRAPPLADARGRSPRQHAW